MRPANDPLDIAQKPNLYRTQAALSTTGRAGCGSHSGPRWYCVEAERFREAEARDRIEDQGFAAFLPQVLVMRSVRPGIMQARAVPAFPGYLFARFDVAKDRWRPIVYTRGVKGLFSSTPERPTPVPAAAMDLLLAQGFDKPIVADLRGELIKVGTKVRITEGAFLGHEGVCLWEDKKRVGLLFDVLGGGQEVTVPRARVEAI